MLGTLSEVRGFAGPFAPRNWAYCDGQFMDIGQNTALFSLLGTNFGGDGRVNFRLPDLRGRVMVHMGAYPGGEVRTFAEIGGIERVVLTQSEMPTHNHLASAAGGVTPVTGTATATMHVNNGNGTIHTPKDNFLAAEENETNLYATSSSGTDALSDQAITVNTNNLSVDTSGIQVAIGDTGGSLSHYNMQPFLVMSWIICINGDYPQRPN